MGVQIFRSTNGLMPVYDNTAGALVRILDAFLWNQLGATRVYNGLNKISYQMPSNSGIWLDVDDTNPAYAVINVYESMVSSALTNKFNGATTLYIAHGVAGGSPWRIISDFYRFYFVAKVSTNNYASLGFGDFQPYRSSEVGQLLSGFVCGEIVTTSPGQPQLNLMATGMGTSNYTGQSGCYIPRNYNSTVFTGGVSFGKYGNYTVSQSTLSGGGPAYPGIANALDIAPIRIFEPGMGTRGLLPGIWSLCQTVPFADGDTFWLNSGAAAGRAFEVVANTGSGGKLLIETSDTWGNI